MLSDVLWEQEILDDSIACILKAIELEPNFRAYYCPAVERASSLHQFRKVVQLYGELARRYPYDDDHDAAALIAYCGMGLPERALVLRHERGMNTDRIRDLDDYLESEMHRKNQAAALVSQEAGLSKSRIHRHDDLENSVLRLEEALKLHTSNPLVRVNLGFALAWAGDAETGLDMMLKSLPELPSDLAETRALANRGYALILHGGASDGLDLISEALRHQADTDGNLDHDALLNAVVSMWIDEGQHMISCDMDSSVELLRRALDDVGPGRADAEILSGLLSYFESQTDPTHGDDINAEIEHNILDIKIAANMAAWEPVISAVLAAREGNSIARDSLERELNDWDRVPDARDLVAVLRSIRDDNLNRDRLSNLSDIDYPVALRCLDILAGLDQTFKDLWRAMEYAPTISHVVTALRGSAFHSAEQKNIRDTARLALLQLEGEPGWSSTARSLLSFLDGKFGPQESSEPREQVHRDFIAVIEKYSGTIRYPG